jgi:hypothetical protein
VQGFLSCVPIYFVSENHVLCAWSEMIPLPVVFLSFARSDGALDDWSIGKHLTGYSPRKVQGRHCLCGLPDFQNPSLDSRPLLQQPRHLRARFWPLPGGSKQSHVLWTWILYCFINDSSQFAVLSAPFKSMLTEGCDLAARPCSIIAARRSG